MSINEISSKKNLISSSDVNLHTLEEFEKAFIAEAKAAAVNEKNEIDYDKLATFVAGKGAIGQNVAKITDEVFGMTLGTRDGKLSGNELKEKQRVNIATGGKDDILTDLALSFYISAASELAKNDPDLQAVHASWSDFDRMGGMKMIMLGSPNTTIEIEPTKDEIDHSFRITYILNRGMTDAQYKIFDKPVGK